MSTNLIRWNIQEMCHKFPLMEESRRPVQFIFPGHPLCQQDYVIDCRCAKGAKSRYRAKEIELGQISADIDRFKRCWGSAVLCALMQCPPLRGIPELLQIKLHEVHKQGKRPPHDKKTFWLQKIQKSCWTSDRKLSGHVGLTNRKAKPYTETGPLWHTYALFPINIQDRIEALKPVDLVVHQVLEKTTESNCYYDRKVQSALSFT